MSAIDFDDLLDRHREAHLERAIAAALRDLATRQHHHVDGDPTATPLTVVAAITREAERRENHADTLLDAKDQQ